MAEVKSRREWLSKPSWETIVTGRAGGLSEIMGDDEFDVLPLARNLPPNPEVDALMQEIVSSWQDNPIEDQLVAERKGRTELQFEGWDTWDESEEAKEHYERGFRIAEETSVEFFGRDVSQPNPAPFVYALTDKREN